MMLIWIALLVSPPVILAQSSSTASPKQFKCFVCGGKDGKCETEDSMGTGKECEAEVKTCFVATNKDETYRKCGDNADIEGDSKCSKIALNNGKDAKACWCKGDLCNSSNKIHLTNIV